MPHNRLRLLCLPLAALAVSCLVFLLTGGAEGLAPTHFVHTVSRLVDHDHILLFAPDAAPRPSIPAPVFAERSPGAADIQVVFDGPWPAAAQSAFNFAVGIWENLLTANPALPIVIYAEWTDQLPPGALGGAGPFDYVRNFPGAPQASTWYPIALANTLANVDWNGPSSPPYTAGLLNPEIIASFSSDFDWYFGTDANPPGNKIDLVTVVLHEIGHGLGFGGSASVGGGMGSWGYGSQSNPSTSPEIYDRFTEDLLGTAIIAYPSPSTQLAQILVSGHVYFDAPLANAFNGGGRVQLYAPGSWQSGSSYSHLDEIYNGGDSDLMTFSLGSGVAMHDPGPVTLGLFKDLGWVVSNPPYFVPVPAVLQEKNTTEFRARYLPAYVLDDVGADKLTFSVLSVSTPNVTADVQPDQYLRLTTQNEWTGTATVSLRVQNSRGLTDQADLTVNVASQVFEHYLPAVVR